MRLESFRQLLRHGLMQPTMEIHTGVDPQSFHRLESLDTGFQHAGRIEPADIFGGVHLDGLEPLRHALFGGALDVARPIAADPSVDAHSLADFASEQLPDWNVQFARFEVPERDVDPREG